MDRPPSRPWALPPPRKELRGQQPACLIPRISDSPKHHPPCAHTSPCRAGWRISKQLSRAVAAGHFPGHACLPSSSRSAASQPAKSTRQKPRRSSRAIRELQTTISNIQAPHLTRAAAAVPSCLGSSPAWHGSPLLLGWLLLLVLLWEGENRPLQTPSWDLTQPALTSHGQHDGSEDHDEGLQRVGVDDGRQPPCKEQGTALSAPLGLGSAVQPQ